MIVAAQGNEAGPSHPEPLVLGKNSVVEGMEGSSQPQPEEPAMKEAASDETKSSSCTTSADTAAALSASEEASTEPVVSSDTGGGGLVDQSPKSSGITAATTTPLLVHPTSASKVIKGEIQQVLVQLRMSDRYVSHSRFVEEHLQDYHPLIRQLQGLFATLCEEEEADLDPLVYLEPFCAAVESREISASVTGAALSALQKFLLYGLVTSPNQKKFAAESLTMISTCLLNCTFEESAGGDELHKAATATAAAAITSSRGVGRPSIVAAASTRNISSHGYAVSSHGHADEQVVLKLLNLSSLVVQCSLANTSTTNRPLLSAETTVGLLDTCLHVSHRADSASGLLKSAAVDALGQIVVQVFSGTAGALVQEARLRILQKLASLLNPVQEEQYSPPQQVAVLVSSLTAINIALETTGQDQWTEDEILVIQNDLCKYLLQWSTTSDDLVVLTLAMRVIFNLYFCMRNHLKVPLEVFLTSVHVRLLNEPTDSDAFMEKKEVALESLVEFCQEPALLQDLYLNYDCDVVCTNLYESIVTALGQAAVPGTTNPHQQQQSTRLRSSSIDDNTAVPSAGVSSSNGTSAAPTGGGTLMGNGAGSVVSNSSHKHNSTKDELAAASTSASINNAPVNALNRLATDGILTILDSIARRCQPSRVSSQSSFVESTTDGASDDGMSSVVTDNDDSSHHVHHLHERKRKKHSLLKVADAFNSNQKDWIHRAVQQDLLDNVENVQGVAELLYTAPGLDKTKLGEYLSKGPAEKFPTEAAVRNHFVTLFDFTDLTFAAALRKFLSKFRLPGEAQCIDRLMEAFSKELYRQQGGSTFFHNGDAVYVLAFSTIMLNTDLHNPTIKEDQRMTREQFVKNNRGINDGNDLPEEFLTELYDQIKDKQIRVRHELGEFMKKHEHEDFRTVWDGILSKSREVATPFFTAAERARSTMNRPDVHDEEMFLVLCKSAIRCLPAVFMRSWDDALVVRILQGMQQMAKIAAFFDVDSVVNDLLQALLPLGRDYALSCVSLDYTPNVDGGASVVSNTQTIQSTETMDQEDNTSEIDTDQPIPFDLLCTSEGTGEDVDITGSAAHRGLLALDYGFVLIRKHASRVCEAWPAFIDCLSALRDARALPCGLSDLDDFADSSGNVLPLSSYAKNSQRRLDEYYRSQVDDQDGNQKKGWFRSFFDKKKDSKSSADDLSFIDDGSIAPSKSERSKYSRTLLAIAEAADVENLVQMSSSTLSVAEKTMEALLTSLDGYPFQDDPVAEQHAIFSLELAARALLSNRDRAPELFHFFLIQFEKVLGRVPEGKVPAPFVLERIVVTVLRSSIHLYDIPELRPTLRASLHLLLMSLPKTFVEHIANRMACGLAIILRNSFHYMETPNEWTFMGDTLDMLANFMSARVFVFDGIASTVEYALPLAEEKEEKLEEEHEEEDIGDRPILSKEACISLSRILIRFVLGFYQGDLSLSVPAMLCLEKLYRHQVELMVQAQAATQDGAIEASLSQVDATLAVPDQDSWQNVAVTVYSVCRSSDPEVSRHGVECYQRLILQTGIDQLPDEKWIAVLYLMVNKQPPIAADVSRGYSFTLLGQLLIRVIPELSHRPDNRDDLADLIGMTATLARENLRRGRRGRVSPLFEKTVQTLTNLSNAMLTEDWTGEPEFSAWASDKLLVELEKVGAAGASIKNQVAIQKPPKQAAPDTIIEGDEEEE